MLGFVSWCAGQNFWTEEQERFEAAKVHSAGSSASDSGGQIGETGSSLEMKFSDDQHPRKNLLVLWTASAYSCCVCTVATFSMLV